MFLNTVKTRDDITGEQRDIIGHYMMAFEPSTASHAEVNGSDWVVVDDGEYVHDSFEGSIPIENNIVPPPDAPKQEKQKKEKHRNLKKDRQNKFSRKTKSLDEICGWDSEAVSAHFALRPLRRHSQSYHGFPGSLLNGLLCRPCTKIGSIRPASSIYTLGLFSTAHSTNPVGGVNGDRRNDW